MAVTAGVAVCLTGLAMVSRTYLLVALCAWLAALGLVRRTLTGIEAAHTVDPLLLVGPIAFAALVAVAWAMGAFTRRTPLANAVLILSAIAILGAVNPLQGGVLTGAAGLLFVLVPTAGFWIGRAFGRRAVIVALATIAILSVPAAAYGLYQASHGFPSWDLRWIATSGYEALYVNGVVRPFSTFSAAAEYTFFLGSGIVIWLAFGLRWSRIALTLPVLALLATGVWLAGTRTVIVTLLAATAFMVAASRRWRLSGAIAGVVVAALALPVVVGIIAPAATSGRTTASTLAQHQISGISNPLDPRASTLAVHAGLVKDGVLSAFTAPLGHGAGSVNIAADRFGGSNRNTEGDPSNAAVAFGLPGLIAFVAVFALGLRTVYRVAARGRDPLALAALGIIVVLFLHWLNGGQYAVAFLPWLMLGWADRASIESESLVATPTATAEGAPA